MRILLCFLFFGLFISNAHADEWYEYIQVHCEPDKKIFAVRDIIVGQTGENGRLVPNIKSIKTPGAIFSKTDKISWTEAQNGDIIYAKDEGINIPVCKIEATHISLAVEHKGKDYPNGIKINGTNPIEFKVVRSSIDQGNVQAQCGGANSAKFTVYANDIALGEYPSAKQRCFGSASRIQTVSHSPRGIKHCEQPNSKRHRPASDNLLTTEITVCHEGPAVAYLEHVTALKSDTGPESDDPKSLEDITEFIGNRELNFRYTSLSRKAHKLNLDLQHALKKNEALMEALEASENESETLRTDLGTLEEKRAAESKKSFWQRMFGKGD